MKIEKLQDLNKLKKTGEYQLFPAKNKGYSRTGNMRHCQGS